MYICPQTLEELVPLSTTIIIRNSMDLIYQLSQLKQHKEDVWVVRNDLISSLIKQITQLIDDKVIEDFEIIVVIDEAYNMSLATDVTTISLDEFVKILVKDREDHLTEDIAETQGRDDG